MDERAELEKIKRDIKTMAFSVLNVAQRKLEAAESHGDNAQGMTLLAHAATLNSMINDLKNLSDKLKTVLNFGL